MPSVSRSLSLRQQCSQGFAYTRRALSLCCSCFPGAIAGRQESPLLHDPVMFYSDGKQPYYYVIIILEDCSVLSLSFFFIIWQKETLSIPIKFVTVRVTMESGRFSIMKTEFISVLLLWSWRREILCLSLSSPLSLCHYFNDIELICLNRNIRDFSAFFVPFAMQICFLPEI